MMAFQCCSMKGCAVVASKSIDIGMSIKKRLDICQRALLGCFNKSIIELLLLSSLLLFLVRCHWCLSSMFAQYRLNQIKSKVQRYSTATRSSIVVVQTHSIASNDMIARGREGGDASEGEAASNNERERERERDLVWLSLSLVFECVYRVDHIIWHFLFLLSLSLR